MATELRSVAFASTPYTNTTSTAIAKGTIKAFGKGCGFNLEAIGATTQAKTPTYPGGASGVYVLSAEMVLADKKTASGHTFAAGGEVYYDAAVGAAVVIPSGKATTSSYRVGKVHAAATTSAATVLILLNGDNPVKKASAA